MGAIEQAILHGDSRGMGRVTRHLPSDYCAEAAQFAWDRPGTVLLATGSFVLHAGTGDTDAPLSAVTVGRALERLGRDVRYVTDAPNLRPLQGLVTDRSKVIEFPWRDRDASYQEARSLLRRLSPSLLMAVERVGFTQGERYMNYRGLDITLAMAKLDLLFEDPADSIGIGDDGNEIGMGAIAKELVVERVTPYPSLTPTTHVVVGTTALWASYGFVGALGALAGTDLLPRKADVDGWLRTAVELGATDALSGRREAAVDGHALDECGEVLERVRRLTRSRRPAQSRPATP